MPIAYCQFGFPTVGGGPFAAGPVIGGSGTSYATIAAAIAGETDTVFADVSVAGTTNGIIVGTAAWPAVDDALTGAFVVLTDSTPGSGKAAVWARIIDYVGATRTATLDSPIDFGVGEDIYAVFPAQVTVLAPLTEDVSVSKNLILDFAGNQLIGSLDVTGASVFAWVKDGVISNGITHSGFALRMDKLTVSAREATIFAFLMSFSGGVGSVECYDCEFRGAVEGHRSSVRWVIKDCTDIGIEDGSGNIVYRLVRDGTLGNVAVSIDSEFSGAIFYAGPGELISSGAPNYLSLFANIKPPMNDTQGNTLSPRSFAVVMCVGSGASVAGMTDGQIAISSGSINNGSATDDPDIALDFALIRASGFTGAAATFTISPAIDVMLDLSAFGGMSSLVTIDGTAATTGPVLLNGTANIIVNLGQAFFADILINGPITGTGSATIGGTGSIKTRGGQYVSMIYFSVNQTADTPAATVGGKTIEVDGALRLDQFGFDTAVTSITVGTWTISSNASAGTIALLNPAGTLPDVGISGGSWVISGGWNVNFNAAFGSSVGVAAAFANGTATLVVSGTWRLKGGTHNNVRINHARSSGGTSCTVTRAGATILTDMTFRSAFAMLFAEVATSVVAGGGNIFFDHCSFEGAGGTMRIVNSAGTLTGPAESVFEYCDFLATTDFETQTGAGTITWVNAVLFFRFPHFAGRFSFIGDPFDDLEMWEAIIDGDTGDKSIVGTGTRPATYRLWKCDPLAGVRDLMPEKIDDYELWPSDGAGYAQGDLMTSDAAGDATAETATNSVEGINLFAVGAVAGVNQVLVRRGMVFVSSDASVTTGDNCIVDTAGTPTNQIAGTTIPGQRVSRALEPTGTTIAGKAYSVVNLM